MKPIVGGLREIKYKDHWHQDKFLQNELYDRVATEEDYDQLPFPYLRSDIKRGALERQRPNLRPVVGGQQFTLIGLLNAVFANKLTTTTEAPKTTVPGPAGETLKTRTRRTTKYKVKGNCKKPPKKHDKEDDSKEDNDTKEKDEYDEEGFLADEHDSIFVK